MMRKTPRSFLIAIAVLSVFLTGPSQKAWALGAQTQELREMWIPAFALMTEQLTAVMIAQVQAIGMFLDAKHQLETQRLFQEKMAEAHKDYHPSEQMCTFGTFARDLSATERIAVSTRTAVAQHIMNRETGNGASVGATQLSDRLSRLLKFRESFCDPGDNDMGLGTLCPTPPDAAMRNRDINYTRTLDQPLSLDINLTDPTVTPDEETVFGLVDNLFAHKPLHRPPETEMDTYKYQYFYSNLRAVTAMRSIARNSFANIIAMKTATPNVNDQTSNVPYMRALLREFGLSADEITLMLGQNPSYHAQMELLTKKIYQSPTFYTNLYDKPANVDRIRAAMKAIKLMQDRDIQSSLMRREMLMSMILEVRLREKAEDVYSETENDLTGETGASSTVGQ